MSNDGKIFFAIVLLMIVSVIGWISFLNMDNSYTELQKQQHSTYETGFIDGQVDYAKGRIIIQKTTREEWTTTQPVINPFIKR